MNKYEFDLAGAKLHALPSGALWWPEARLVAVGDLHLGKTERQARLGGAMLPPYETTETLQRLDEVIRSTDPATVVSVGDAFDDIYAAMALEDGTVEMLQRLAAGRRWIWIAGNHDPGQLDLPGSFLRQLATGPLVFRHIASGGIGCGVGEVSAHYHPKARFWVRGQRIARPCFLVDAQRAILPAFGTYTGGLDVGDKALSRLMGPDASVLLTGTRVTALPYRLPA